MPEYVERQKVIDVLNARRNFAQNHQYGDDVNLLDLMIERINAIPDVTGRWIETDDGKTKCSLCGLITNGERLLIGDGSAKWPHEIQYPRFCMNCGARMEVKKDDN